MRKKKCIVGTCALCDAQNAKLTIEHIFPGAKRNHTKPFQVKIKDPMYISMTEKQQSRNFQELSRDGLVITHEQGGPKKYSLCEKCNNTTGSWYGNAYIDWKKQWEQIANSNLTPDVQSIEGEITFNPLRLLKQIVSCYISVDYSNHKGDLSKDNLRNLQPKLFDFVLDRGMRCSFNDLRIFVHLLRKNTRQGFYTGRITTFDTIRNKVIYPYTVNLIDDHVQYSLIFDTNTQYEPKYNRRQILDISKYGVYQDQEITKKLRIQEIDGLLKIEAVPQTI